MSWMEQRKKRFEKINSELKKMYKTEICCNQETFINGEGRFRIFEFTGENALCLEYAESENEARLNLFEDGDRFYLDEYPDEEKMLQAMIEEIKQ